MTSQQTAPAATSFRFATARDGQIRVDALDAYDAPIESQELGDCADIESPLVGAKIDLLVMHHPALVAEQIERELHAYVKLGEGVRALRGENGSSGDDPTEAEPSVIRRAWADRPQGGDIYTLQPPRRDYLLRLPTKDGKDCPPREGDGFLPRGKVGILSSPGGTGKTNAVVQLALSVATGRPWLGHFHVDRAAPGRVLLLLGEEDRDEVWRRLYYAARSLHLSPDEVEAAVRNIVALPLAGKLSALLQVRDGAVYPTREYVELRALLDEHAGDEGWGLVVIDPLSRFCGIDAESDNTLATTFIQFVEGIASTKGNPAVLVIAHSSKLAVRAGTADSRGVTGLTDGARWHATLTPVGDGVEFEVRKSNYCRPTEKLRLERGDGGLLNVESEEDRDARLNAEERLRARAELDRFERLIPQIVDIVRKQGPFSTRDAIVRAAGVKLAHGRAALARALDRNLVVQSGTSRKPQYEIGGSDA